MSENFFIFLIFKTITIFFSTAKAVGYSIHPTAKAVGYSIHPTAKAVGYSILANLLAFLFFFGLSLNNR
jgi:hypothetical protein